MSLVKYDPKIGKELEKRIRREGGQHGGNIRISLLWYDRNDLDLHVVVPSGERIFFGHKISECQGKLDVDMNVSGESLEPVENVFWPAGLAPAGIYEVLVKYFGHHGWKGQSPYVVEVSINGVSKMFKGAVEKVGQEHSICRFKYKGCQGDGNKELLSDTSGISRRLLRRDT